jgi:hypothetical protein
MKQKLHISILTALAISLSAPAQATLFDRGAGMIYDDVLNVTWLQDANHANTISYVTAGDRDVTTTGGKMTWDEAAEWTAQLNYGGYSDWRLPDVKPVNGTNFQINVSFDGSTDFGEHIISPQSELSYMYFVNLNNDSVHDTSGNLLGCGSSDSCLTNTGLFNNLIPDNYWFGVEVDPTPAFAWSFNTQHGIQTLFDGKPNEFYAWAVHDGDIAAVPIPAAFWFFNSAFIGLMGLNRNRA